MSAEEDLSYDPGAYRGPGAEKYIVTAFVHAKD